ncbi:S-layer homology domain-containing protein [Sporosarcina sp. GW1-11]|uniref:S-layer homology domain-containing protein n=1 Tax=Sporosarcina sp. GW1-11 TaxID=2899126 RepID=UPI00294C6BD5|nr:S-layer homology domain-containing protein [Sporosarcina sp. GW1-11]MDV6378875.1 S-layer homology domain-containing protein [Sporosarcina sp. GW1-11]
MFIKILLSLLTFVVVFALLTQWKVQASGFSDVTNYKREIEYLSGKGIITGYEDGSFKPSTNVTRLQAVTMILREKGITDFTAADPGFTDLKKGNYGYDKVAKAVELGIISGKTNEHGSKYFDAGAPLTRGQMSKILVQGYNLRKTVGVRFKDVLESNGFKGYISILATENITTGYLDGTFRPNHKLTREHFAVFMARMLNGDFKPEKNPNPAPNPIPVPKSDPTPS